MPSMAEIASIRGQVDAVLQPRLQGGTIGVVHGHKPLLGAAIGPPVRQPERASRLSPCVLSRTPAPAHGHALLFPIAVPSGRSPRVSITDVKGRFRAKARLESTAVIGHRSRRLALGTAGW
jgi:hypothetical protein